MKAVIQQIHRLFPGEAFRKLILSVIALFLVSILDMLGVAVILPILQLATGAEITGYLDTINRLFGSPERSSLIVILSLVLVLSFIVKGIVSLAIKWWSSGFIARQQTATSVTLLDRMMHDSYLVHRTRTTAGMLRNINDAVGQAYSAYVMGALSVVGEFFSILVIMLMLLVVMPVPALIAFTYFGVVAFLMQHFLKKSNTKQGVALMKASMGSTSAVLEAIVGFRETRMHGVTDRYTYRYQAKRLEAVEAQRRSNFMTDLPKYLLEVIFIIGIALLMGYMSFTGGSDSAPYLLVFAGACIRILPSYTRLVASLGLVRLGSDAMDLVDRELRQLDSTKTLKLIEHEPDIKQFARVNDRTRPINVEVEDVSFRYPDGDTNVLSNISFSVPAGSSVAFVGGSGSGKTTLVDIILGLFEPTSGAVLSNGKNINDNLSSWFSEIGYVPQDVFLGDATVREAIAFGMKPEEIDESRVLECIRIAELEDVVESLDQGMHTMIGEHGTRLSGGQRQRLGIARAMYRRPSLLILDEATSALDNETEHKITQTIDRISKEITVIIVAHRLSTVRHVDQLLYLSQGKIVSSGTFSEVQADNAEFANLVRLGQLPG